MKYIKASEIVDLAELQLGSYADAGNTNRGLMFDILSRTIGTVKGRLLPTFSEMVAINNKTVILPENFVKLNYAYGCGGFVEYNEQPTHQLLEEFIGFKYQNLKDPCDTSYCIKPESELKIVEKTGIIKREYNHIFPIKVIKDNKLCMSKYMGNVVTQASIDVKDTYAITNFDGNLFINYQGKLEDAENDLIVPDNDIIKNWLINVCMYQTMEYLYLNGNGDYLQRMQYLQTKLNDSMIKAKTLIKNNELGDFYKAAQLLYNRYNRQKL